MYKLPGFVLMSLFATPAKADEPTWKEIKRLEIVYQTLNAVDAIQTIDCLNRNVCVEANPLLGRNPSTEKIIGVKLAGGILHYFVIKKIYEQDPQAARIAQYLSIGLQGSVVAANLRFTF